MSTTSSSSSSPPISPTYDRPSSPSPKTTAPLSTATTSQSHQRASRTSSASSSNTSSRTASLHPPTPTLTTLLPHLLASKHSLASITHVHRASALCASTRIALESAALTTSHTRFLLSGTTSQLAVLDTISARSGGLTEQATQEFEEVVAEVEEVDSRLGKGLRRLRDTRVERGLLNGEDGGERSLLSFVDEGRVEGARGVGREVLGEVEAVVRGFVEGVEGFRNGVEAVRSLVAGAEELEEEGKVLTEILQEMDDRAREMAAGLESLVGHFDLCVRAVKHVEGGNDAAMEIGGGLPDGVKISGEVEVAEGEDWRRMMHVVMEDAGQVEDVVAEIKAGVDVMEGLGERVETVVEELAKRHENAITAIRMLEEIGEALPNIISASRAFVKTWEGEKSKIDERLEELEGLRDFCDEFLRAYDNLLIEIGRRREFEERMEKEVESAMRRIEQLYEDDLEEREAFRKEQGDFLPVDIWPGVMGLPVRYRVLAEEEVERVPDISASVIHAAIRRVHGSQ